MALFFSSDGGRLFFEQDRNRKTTEFPSDRVDQIGNAFLTCVRD
jgi:hypothetical protein